MESIATMGLESTRIENVQVKNKKRPTIAVMILTILYEIQDRRGVSLQWFRKNMEEKYSYTMSSMQYKLFKKNLHSMLIKGTIEKLSGKGLTGRFNLAKSERESVKKFMILKKQQLEKRSKENTDFITPDESIITAKMLHDRVVNAPIKRKSLDNAGSLLANAEISQQTECASSANNNGIHITTPLSRRPRFV